MDKILEGLPPEVLGKALKIERVQVLKDREGTEYLGSYLRVTLPRTKRQYAILDDESLFEVF